MRILTLLIALVTLHSCATTKIKDCPEEKIINEMPTVGDNGKAKEYYIYKGARKEIKDFDAEWLKKNCPNIPVQTVH